MASSVVEEGLAAIREHSAAADAGYLRYFRDSSDSFAMEVDARAPELKDAGRHAFFPLLPGGSQWGHCEGWRSFFVHPFKIGKCRFWVVGMEGVVPHPARGSYPVMAALVFSTAASAVASWSELATWVSRLRSDSAILRGMVQGSNESYLISRHNTPEGFKRDERTIMEAGVPHVQGDKDCVTRTLAVTEGRLPFHALAPLRFPISITGVSRPAFFGFSKSTRRKLRWTRGSATEWPWRRTSSEPEESLEESE